jgi:hypothetical protein
MLAMAIVRVRPAGFGLQTWTPDRLDYLTRGLDRTSAAGTCTSSRSRCAGSPARNPLVGGFLRTVRDVV